MVKYKKSIVFISSVVEHNFKFVRAVQIRIIAEIKKIVSNVQKKFYITDGSAAQYKNKTNFYFLSQHKSKFGFNGTWVFHATSHGKGAHDGIGGTIKRMLRTECLKDIPIKNACDAYNFLLRKYETEETKIQPFMLTPQEINVVRAPQNLKSIPGTQGYHHISEIDNKKLSFKKISNSQEEVIIEF